MADRASDMRNRLDERPSQLPASPQDRWKERQGDWQNWQNAHYSYHAAWYHGSWHTAWNPGAYWNHWWNNYPVLTAFGVTTWAVNRVGWAFGYYQFSNPYVTQSVNIDNSTYNYSEPLVMTPQEQTLAADPASTAPTPGVSPAGLASFDQARRSFFSGDYQTALSSTDAALREIPNDAMIHEFRALIMFALGRYQDAAAILYPVLGVGPGWDWTTMIGFYPGVDQYTEQLRALEQARDSRPTDPAINFVLAYHYLTAGHNDAAERCLRIVLQSNPQDQLAKQLLMQVDPTAELPNPPSQADPPKPETPIDANMLKGDWAATRDGGEFSMKLNDNETFAWTYSQGADSQQVTGVWEVGDDGVLALEMNDQGVMLAQVVLNDDELDFYMLGDTQGAEPLKFSKQ